VTNLIQFSLLGLGAGAIYSVLAIGVVMIYRGSGVINFAHGGMAMLGAFMFYVLREENGWAVPLALVASVLIVTLVGAATYRWVMRPLRRASSLARQIATLGVLSVLLAVGSLVWGNEVRLLPTILPNDLVTFGDYYVSQDRLTFTALAVVVTVTLTLVFRRSMFGLATSAVAEFPAGLSLLGWSPDAVATLNWAIGAGLAGAAGILIAPIAGLEVQGLTFLVIPALAAALLGSFKYFPLVLAGGLAIGIAESLASFYADARIARAASFAVIVVVIVVRGRGLPIRSEFAERLPALGNGRLRPVPILVASGVLVLLQTMVFSLEIVESLNRTIILGVLVLSLVVVTGYAGQISLAQYAIAGIGAMVAGATMDAWGWPFELAAPVGVLCATVFGLAFAIPAFRTRGVNLAVITLGLGMAVHSAIFVNANVVPTNGIDVGEWSLFGIEFDPSVDPRPFAVLVTLVFVASAVLVANLRRSRAGRRLIAVRGNERAAASLGVNVMGAKLYAFGVAAALAGVAGILLAFQSRVVTLGQFDAFSSIQLFAYALIGGLGYVIAPLFGAPLAPNGVGPVVGDKFPLIELGQYFVLAGGIGMVIILNLKADGLASIFHRRRRVDEGGIEDDPRLVVSAERRRVAEAVLEVKDVSMVFGTSKVLDDVSLQVGPGEVVGLIGPNGAGKTTFLDVTTGFVRPVHGSVLLNGRDMTSWPVHRRARAGVGRSFQGLELFEDLTVAENLQAASDDGSLGVYFSSPVWPGQQPFTSAAAIAVRDFGLGEVLDILPPELPHGMRHLVAVARAVAREPSILLLDEPAAGLDETESLELSLLIRRLADEWGIGILLIEHDVPFVMRICDRVTVLDFGGVIASGSPEEVQRDELVIAAYLGAAAHPDNPEPPARAGVAGGREEGMSI
jgi:ABC-type branched-subunit amino acid transport system ATPase component/branched-subunit amino acid ABC-type transport system permease component